MSSPEHKLFCHTSLLVLTVLAPQHDQSRRVTKTCRGKTEAVTIAGRGQQQQQWVLGAWLQAGAGVSPGGGAGSRVRLPGHVPPALETGELHSVLILS